MDRRTFLVGAAVAPFSLGVVARAATAERAHAFVTADLEAHVVVIDATTGRIVARIPTHAGPRSIETAGSIAVAAHTASGLLTLVDADALRVRRVIRIHGAPRYAAARGRLAYVTDSARRELVTVDVVSGRVVAREVVPGPARHVTISADGGTIWTALGSTARTVAVLDASRPLRPRLVRTLTLPFLAHDVVAAPDGEHTWVTSGDARRLAVFDRVHRAPVEILTAGSPPQHVAFSESHAFVTSGDDGTCRVHRLDGQLVREAELPVGSFNVSFANRVAVSPSLTRGTIAVLAADGRVRSVRKIARAAHDACLITS